jgi:uncharacterized membrane protein YhaH (DUF805 family)
MGFGRAIDTCFRKYVVFDGRAGRAEYWWWFLFQTLVLFGASSVGAVGHLSTLLGVVALLALALPNLAVAARRLHDINCSAWWLLIGAIPFGGLVLLVMACFPGTRGPNRFGSAWQ